MRTIHTKDEIQAVEDQIASLEKQSSDLRQQADRLRVQRDIMCMGINIQGYWSTVAMIQEKGLDNDYDQLQLILSAYENARSTS